MSNRLRGMTLTKKVSLPGGGKRGSGPSTCPSGKVFISSAIFYIFDKSLADLGKVGLSQLLCVDWLLA